MLGACYLRGIITIVDTLERNYPDYEQPPSAAEAESTLTMHTTRVIGELAAWPLTSVIVGPPDSGKSRVVNSVLEVVESAGSYSIHYIDGNAQRLSPDNVGAMQHNLLRFDAHHVGDSALIVVDHFEKFTGYYGQDRELNEARKGMLRTIEGLSKRFRTGSGSLSFLFSALSKSGSYPPEPTKAAMKFFNSAFLKGFVYPITGLHPDETLEPAEFYSPRLLESDKAARAAAKQAQKVSKFHQRIDDRTKAMRYQMGSLPLGIDRLPGSPED